MTRRRCSNSLTTSPDFSAWCSSCAFKSRDQIYADTGGVGIQGRNDRSTIAGVRWVDEAMGTLYAMLSENGVLDR